MKTEDEIIEVFRKRMTVLMDEHERRQEEIHARYTKQAEQSAFCWGLATATVFWVGLAWILNLLTRP